MKHTTPLRFNYEFSRVYKRGRYLTGNFVVVHFLKRKGQSDKNRLGVTVSRNVSGSVRRNRLKRLIRESYRLMEDELVTGYDLIITGRQKDAPPTFVQLDRELGRILRRAGLRGSADTQGPSLESLTGDPGGEA